MNFWKKKLTVRLAIYFLLLSLTVIIIICSITYIQAREALKTSVVDRLEVVVKLKKDALDRWTNQQFADVLFISRSPDVKENAHRLIQHAPATAMHHEAYAWLIDYFDLVLTSKKDLDEILILDYQSGEVILSTNQENQGNNLSDADYFPQVQSKPFVQGIYLSPDARPTITVVIPWRTTPSDPPFAVMVTHLDLDNINRRILERTNLGETGETYMVYTTHTLLSVDNGPLDTHYFSEGIDTALQGHDGSGLYRNYEGQPVIGVYRWVELHNTALIAEIHQQEAFAPAWRQAWIILLIGLTAVIVLAIAVSWLSRHITRPILAITETATQVAAGDLTPSAPVMTRDEVGVLAQAFNQMTTQLRTLYQRLEQRLHTVVSHAPIILFATDNQGTITLLEGNVLTELNIQAEPLIGQTIFDLYTSPEVTDDFSRVLNGEDFTSSRELAARTFEIRYSPIYEKDGTLSGVIGVATDMTERLRAEAALREAKDEAEAANRAKSAFLANMSHELRTPLNAIIGYSEILHEEAVDMEVDHFVNDLEKIGTAGRHLLDLISGILDLSKIEAGKMELNLTTCDITALIDGIVSTIEPLLGHNNNRLEVRCDPQIGSMYADEMKVRQILLNLLSNACKFTSEGTISLLVTRDQQGPLTNNHHTLPEPPILTEASTRDERAISTGWIIFTVRDTGIGLTLDQLDHIFEAFTQADASTTRQYGGTGLGLAVSQRFCAMMGGTITVTSEPGQGATFTVYLPAEVSTRQPAPIALTMQQHT